MSPVTGTVVVVGDVVLDRDLDGRAERLCPDAPVPVLDDVAEMVRPGGAGLAAWLAAEDGPEIVLVTPLGDDEISRTLRDLLEPRVRLVALPLTGRPVEKTRIRAGGHPLVRVDRAAPLRVGAPDLRVDAALATAQAVLVSDYGLGTTAEPRMRRLLAAAARRIPLVWDPHPRGTAPVARTALLCPNLPEALACCGAAGSRPSWSRPDRPLPGRAVPAHALPGRPLPNRADVGGADFSGADLNGADLNGADLDRADLDRAARSAYELLERYRASSVAVTLGGHGALLSLGDGAPLVYPTTPLPGRDTCGAGDRFAATAVCRLAGGALPSEAVQAAVAAATEFVGRGAASVLYDASRTGPSRDPVAAVRDRGGVVVATGGCFDVLHAGHVATLRAARALGDCLVVCLNSDASVRRAKGPDRPVNPAADRAAVLAALDCVDVVQIFEEDTPAEVLRVLRPDIWAKGGDYSIEELPEAAVVAGWGGRTVVLPYLPGHSTTDILSRWG